MRKSLLAFALLLTACSDDRPPAPTAEENARLDEAEAMLNEEANVPEICKTHPPYDDAKYDEWRARALEAGCDTIGNSQ